MDISKIVFEGLPVGQLKADAGNIEKFYHTIATLLFASKCRECESSVTVSRQENGTIIAESSPTIISISLPYKWTEIVAWSSEAWKYGAWAEPDLKEMTSPKFIFTASRKKTVYRAMNFLRMNLTSYGNTLTFTEKDKRVFCTTLKRYVDEISFDDLKEVCGNRRWLDLNRMTYSTWKEGQWKNLVFFRKN